MTPFRIADSWKSRIPAHTAELLESYVNHGPQHLSSFHICLLSGDGFGAACLADAENLSALGVLLQMIAQDFPGDCYGSREAVERWQGLLHGKGFEVPESWAATVEELRRDGPKTFEEWEESAKERRNLN